MFLPDVVVRPPDEALEGRPYRLDTIRGTEVPRGVVAPDVEVSEELGDPLVQQGAVRADRALRQHVREEESVARLLVVHTHDRKDDAISLTLNSANERTLVPVPPFAHERLIHLDGSSKWSRFVHEVALELPVPSTHRWRGDPRDPRSGSEGGPILPAGDEEPELPIREFGISQPGDTPDAEGTPTPRASVSILRAVDVRTPAPWAGNPATEGAPPEDSPELRGRRNGSYNRHRNSVMSEGLHFHPSAVPTSFYKPSVRPEF